MKKMLYIGYVDGNEYIGLKNKINAQCQEFSKYYETILVYPQREDIIVENVNRNSFEYIKNKFKIHKQNIGILNKINSRIKIIKFNLFVKKIISREKPEIIYIRRYEILNGIKILKDFKKKNITYIIYEIPTYPYGEEYLKSGKKLKYIINEKMDRSMEKVANIIPVVLGQDVSFNCDKYFPTFNGIDIKNISVKSKNVLKKNRIDLVGMANVSFWHGYDRVIEGLKRYYDEETKIKVFFNIIGDGEEIANLKKIVKEYRLDHYVVFHSVKRGKELDDIISYCELGVGSIANHRKGFTKDSALKNREYCARGIPFIIASRDDAFESLKYIYKIPPDETSVNINKLLEFYNDIKNEDYTHEMREYAENNVTWEAVMKPIVNIINKNIN